ncbi:hypothetical protein AURDEDRAFT_175912 [Auricularia subglabra TFB-10046 SS5]|uniref:Uncharacterized protein n=1 Tax=Auricularia subglabra (strain TFB-10046 / SS5) TaxID=717982 RepID=J0WQY1_AURST|nr:hypothetical protein AURDEDRAFT_175912 [Auricularia subglabra TFB-10046 SS5]
MAASVLQRTLAVATLRIDARVSILAPHDFADEVLARGQRDRAVSTVDNGKTEREVLRRAVELPDDFGRLHVAGDEGADDVDERLEPLPSRARIRANTHWCQRFTVIANDLDFPLLLANFASHSVPLLERYSDGFFTFHPALTPCAHCSQAALSPDARICLRVSNKGKCLSCLLGNIPGDCFADLDSTLEVEHGDDDDDDPPSRKRKNSTTTAPQDPNKMRKTDEKVSSSSRPRRSGPFGPASVQAQSQNYAAGTAGVKKAGSAAGSKPAKKTRPGDAEMDIGAEDQSVKPPPVVKPVAPAAGDDFPGPQSIPLPCSAAAAGAFDQYRRFAPIDPVNLTFKWNDAVMTVFNSIIDLKRDFIRVFGAPGQSRTSLGLLVPDFVAFQAWLEEREAERGHIEEVEEMAGDGGAGPSRDPSVEVVSLVVVPVEYLVVVAAKAAPELHFVFVQREREPRGPPRVS